jgi:cytochrome c biogenesis protein CcdA
MNRFLRGLTDLLGFTQLLFGAFGFFGVYLYLVDSNENPSRYQALFIPVYSFIFAVPILLLSALLYRRCKSEMRVAERWLFNIGCAIPLVALAVAMAIGNWS